jgi:hypothetical protein
MTRPYLVGQRLMAELPMKFVGMFKIRYSVCDFMAGVSRSRAIAFKNPE